MGKALTKVKSTSVTGAASGMGYEIVRGFAQSDARGIAMIDINDKLGMNVHKDLEAEFPNVKLKYYHLNISEYEEVSEQFSMTMDDADQVMSDK